MSDISVRPRSIIASESAPHRNLAHFVLKLRNQIGALEAVSGLAARKSVNILSGFHEAPVGSDASWSFFADMTDAKLSTNRLADEYSRMPMVLDVKFRESSTGFISDAFHFPIRLGNRPLIMLSVDSMAAIFRHIREMLGAGTAANVIIHQMGIATGKEIYGGFESRFGKNAPREVLEEFLHFVRAAGWGWETLKELDVQGSTARVEFAHNAECSSYDRASTPQSQFVRGTYSGFFSGLFGRPVQAEEGRCIAKGDIFCEFVVKSVKPDSAATALFAV